MLLLLVLVLVLLQAHEVMAAVRVVIVLVV